MLYNYFLDESLVCFITTFLLPARRSFVSFQHGSPGQTFILLCQSEKEGKPAGSAGYRLSLEGCIQFCFLHCSVFAGMERKSDWLQSCLKGKFSRSKDLSGIMYFFMQEFMFFIIFGEHKSHLQISCHLTTALKAEEGCYEPSYPDGMRMSGCLKWTEIADGGGGP